MKKNKFNANAEVWAVNVSGSVLDMVHGFSQKIVEFHIPKENISFNIVSDVVHVFKTYEGRYECHGTGDERNQKDIATKLDDVYVDPKTIKLLVKYLELKDKIKEKVIEAYESNNKNGHQA